MMSRGVSLLHDNARSTQQGTDFSGTANLIWLRNCQQPSYSLDLAPLDFYLFIEEVSGWKTSFQRRRGQADGGYVAEGLVGEIYDTGV